MRWISTAAQSECQGQETGGRSVLRASSEGGMGFSYTDTSVPSADGNRRCALAAAVASSLLALAEIISMCSISGKEAGRGLTAGTSSLGFYL